MVATALSVVGAIGLVAAVPGGSEAAGHRRAPLVRIVSPTEGALRTGRVVTVAVRTRQSRPRLRVTMYGAGTRLQYVGGDFHRVGPGRLVARLRVGRELRFGANSIFVGIRGSSRNGGAAEVHFTVARPGHGLVDVRRVEAGRFEVPPLNIRVGSRGGETEVRATLNGRNARPSFERLRSGHWRAALGPKDGLQFGRNHLLVTAFTPSGRYQRVRRSFSVRRDGPIADAGADRLGRVGTAVKLDASATVPAAGGSRLRWRIVHKPKGARPRLLRAHSAHPQLVADANGTYRLRLVASGAPSHRDIRASALADAGPGTNPAGTETSPVGPETPPVGPETNPVGPATSPAGTEAPPAGTEREPPGGAPPATSDEVVAEVAPDLRPSGLPVQTLATQGSETGIEFGGAFYPAAAGAVAELMVVDRTTLVHQPPVSYQAGEEGKLLEAVDAAEDGDLVILSGTGHGPYTAPAPVLEAIAKIGGITSGSKASGDFSELDGGEDGWSAIGIPGLPAGQAYQSIGLQQGPGGRAGGMQGNLQPDSGGTHWAFSWAPEFHPFDTNVPPAAPKETENTMSVGEERFSSYNLPFPNEAEKTGFQLVWLDADTLQPRLDATFEANLWASEEEGEKGLWPLRNDLRQILAEPKPGILMLNTIGNVSTPSYTNSISVHGKKEDGNDIRGNVLARLASLLQEFGANPYVFDTLGATGFGGAGTPGGYSLVGVTGLRRLKGPNAGAERSTRLIPNSTARLTGVLHRNRQGVLEPSSTGSPDPSAEVAEVQPEIVRLVAEPGEPFPAWSELSAAEQAAQEELAKKIGLSVDTRLDGIQTNFWGDTSIKWGDELSEITSACVPTSSEPTPCSPAAAAMVPQLIKEFSAVETVRSYFTADESGKLMGVFDNVFGEAGLGLTNVAEEIRDVYKPPETLSATGPDALGILGGVLGIAGGIGEFVPVAGDLIGPAAEVTAGVTEIIEASASGSGGESAFDPYGYHTTVAGLAGDLKESIKQSRGALNRLADLLVSYPGTLARAKSLIKEDKVPGNWALSTTAEEQLEGQLRQTLLQFMWLTLLQPVVGTAECAAEDIGGVAKHNPEAVMQTLVNYPEWEQRQSPRTFNLYDSSITLSYRAQQDWPVLLEKKITESLFGNPESGEGSSVRAGLLPEYLMAPSLEVEGPETESELFQNILPSSGGLLHKDMGLNEEQEVELGLARRNHWSAYTPSCGKAEKLKWSNPEYQTWASP